MPIRARNPVFCLVGSVLIWILAGLAIGLCLLGITVVDRRHPSRIWLLCEIHAFHVGNPDEPKWLHVLVSKDVSIVDRPSQMQKHLAIHHFPHLLAPRDSLYFSVFSPSNRPGAEPFALIGSDVRHAPDPRNCRDWRRNAEGSKFKHSENDYIEGVSGSDILYLESRLPLNIRNWEVGWNRVDGQMGAILGLHYIYLPKRGLSGSLAHVSGLLCGDSLPSDYEPRSDDGPSGDSFRPRQEYVPPGQVIIGVFAFFFAGWILFRRGRRSWDELFLAAGFIFLGGAMFLVGHEYYCPDEQGYPKEQPTSTKESLLHNLESLLRKHGKLADPRQLAGRFAVEVTHLEEVCNALPFPNPATIQD
jgi:hypothetical protein